jgi:excisionase family DNA binding protein
MVVKSTPTRTQRRLFRIPAAYEYLGGAVKEATLRQWIWRRQIESVHIGRAVCIPQDALDRLIDKGTVPALKVRS